MRKEAKRETREKNGQEKTEKDGTRRTKQDKKEKNKAREKKITVRIPFGTLLGPIWPPRGS